MPIGLTPEHEDLRKTVRRWLETYCPPEVPRATLESTDAALPAIWPNLCEQGWLGLHIAESEGGQGFGLVELAVVLEECGRALVPGPILATVLTAAVVAEKAEPSVQAAFLPGLVDGTTPAGIHLGPGALRADPNPDTTVDTQALRVSGILRPVLGAPTARLVLAPIDGQGWCILDTEAEGVAIDVLPALDSTRPIGQVTASSVVIDSERRLPSLDHDIVRDLALALAAAESAGSARWCLDTASDYAKIREQFGRPIGQFQAIKHRLADMLVSVEQIDALAWDAAQAWTAGSDADAPSRALASAVSGAIVQDAYADCAKACVQILGGVGFTWEHDAHLYLRRALATRQLLEPSGNARRRATTLAFAGARRTLTSDLPPEAEPIREEIEPLMKEVATLDGDAQRRFLVDSGLFSPHWPRPWGREASPLEQLVIDEALGAAGVFRPGIAVGAWALPTIITHGTDLQQERWIRATLLGEITWCQLFSEPGAGSDLAALSTRAICTEGGWNLTGQKVWTSLAHSADWGICLARTDATVPKHEGITYFIVDMKSEGLDIRPLRELTGTAMFNEVFLNEVFVPDDCVVGEPGGGWKIGRTTLANERVSMSSGATFGTGVESVLRQLERLGDDAPAGADVEVGALVAEAQSCRLLGHRATLRSLSGTEPGAGSSVRKLLGAEHEQRIQEMGLALLGADGAAVDGRGARWSHGFLVTRCLTIAGGTSEVQRNVMAERLLGQPRDPEPVA